MKLIQYNDRVWIEEDYGNGQFGPNILPKPWMAHHLYGEQRNSYAFDKVLALAEENGVYLYAQHRKIDYRSSRYDLPQPAIEPDCLNINYC